MKHFLACAHQAMMYAGQGYLWLPHTTTWRHYVEWPSEAAARQAIRRAQRAGYLSEYTGIPQLTQKGYQTY